jgi:dolichol kinase
MMFNVTVTTASSAAIWRGVSLIGLVVVFQVAAAKLNLQREAKRRWQHAVTGHALVQISYYLPVPWCVAALLAASSALWFVRTYHSDLYLQNFGPLLRPSELKEHCLPGAFYFLMGAAITAALFPITSARYAVECLSIADPMAAWVGQSIESPKVTASASVIGCIACFLVAWGIGYVMLNDSDTDVHIFIITAGALVCSFAEALPIGNDNLTIPIATAFAVEIARWRVSIST